MEKLSDLLEMAKVSDIIATKKEKEDNKIVWALAIIGAIAAVAGIAFAVYKYLTPDYMDDFDEDFDDDFDDDFFLLQGSYLFQQHRYQLLHIPRKLARHLLWIRKILILILRLRRLIFLFSRLSFPRM